MAHQLRKNLSEKKSAEQNSEVSESSGANTGPTTSPEAGGPWKARVPLKIDAARVIDTERRPFSDGMHSGDSSIVEKLPTKPPDAAGRTDTTSYYVKPTVGHTAAGITKTSLARRDKVDFVSGDTSQAQRSKPLRKLHFALTEVTAGLAFQRFFGGDFTPKSRLIESESGEPLVGMKIQPGLQTFKNIEDKIGTKPIRPWEPDWDPEDTNMHQPTVTIREDGAAVLPTKPAEKSSSTQFDYPGKEVIGLGKLAAATWFLAERDTNSGNFGVVPTDNPDTVRIVKIDHGASLSFETRPGSTTRAWENLNVEPAEMLTAETLKKRLEDVGGNFPATSKPFKEFVDTFKQIASMADDELTAHIDAIVGVYPAEHKKDEGILEADLRSRLQERLNFAREAVAAYDARGAQ